MKEIPKQNPESEEAWRVHLTEGFPDEIRLRRLFGALPKSPRCKSCYAPFKGIGGVLVRMIYNKRPSSHNPLICNACEEYATRHPGGAEVELTMLFADVRGSTTLAEKMNAMEFGQLINRFYQTTFNILVRYDAMIDRLAGDQMIGYFLSGLAGPTYTRNAVQAALEILRATGHASPSGPWIPVGIGLHHGIAFFGAVGTREGVIDITALGDAVNTAARLASEAPAGQILVSEPAFQVAEMDLGDPEKRVLTLKGRSEPVSVRVIELTQ